MFVAQSWRTTSVVLALVAALLALLPAGVPAVDTAPTGTATATVHAAEAQGLVSGLDESQPGHPGPGDPEPDTVDDLALTRSEVRAPLPPDAAAVSDGSAGAAPAPYPDHPVEPD